ncbi:hypothetical protein [Pseudalkalibacillus sp. SCS-8]|uniref:SPOR domain-containing protein n=1 Tax=Pseudalkalibacillus nanhaiensis TaxID=3115291 RepID=UPI0032DBCFEA
MPEKDKGISIRVNGKDRPVREMRDEEKLDDQEIAASIDADSADPFFELAPPKDVNPSNVYLFHANRDEKQWDESEYFTNERKPGLPIQRKKQREPEYRQLPSPKIPFRLPKQLLVPIGSAVLIGCLIGLIVLMIFTGEEFQSQSTPVSKDTPASPVQNPVSSPKVNTLDFTVSPFVVQGGLYTSLSSAEEIASNIKAKGYAAVVDKSDNRVFIGIGGSLTEVKELSALYEESGILAESPYPYQRPMEAEAVQVPDTLNVTWLVKGKELLEAMFSTANSNPSEVASWKKEALASISELPSQQQPLAVAFVNAMGNVSEISGDRWTVQQAKLDALIHYKALIESF